jgi:hypothetical protein
MAIAGHVSKKMLQHCSHVRMDAKRNALDALIMKPELKGASRGTAKGTTGGLQHKQRHKGPQGDGRAAGSC